MDGEPPEEITTVDCPHCGKCMDVSDLRPFSLAVCPGCEGLSRVRAQMGSYLILGKLGKGGMSIVFRAEDNLLSRHVALKILNENYSKDEARISRFEQEARVMAKVQHPHIVKIYGVGRDQGYFYIAMELVEGRDVETALQESGKVSEPEVLRTAVQIAEALKEAWKAGLVHRDIKPANILVDEKGNAKIVDFGLSLLQHEKSQEEEIWVTPFYASPEALAREAEDFRSDMYALGATLAHLFIGKIPLADLPKNAAELRERKKTWPSLKKWCPEISPLSRRIVDRLMQFSPENRYNSYDELIGDINAALAALYADGDDWQTRRRVLRRQERRKIWRNWLLIAGGACVALALIGGGIALWMAPPPKPVPIVRVEQPQKQQPRMGMTTEQIEQTYWQGEKSFREKNIPGALREFGELIQEPSSPLSVSAWASIQCTLMSWAVGDFSDVEDTCSLRAITKKVRGMAEEEKKSMGLDQTEMVMEKLLDSRKDYGNKTEFAGRLSTSLLVGAFLQDWKASRCSLAVEKLKELKKIAEEQNDGGTFAREWLANLQPYQHDAIIWKSLKEMPEKTTHDISKKLDLCRSLIDQPESRQSPGKGFAGALVLYEKRLKIEEQKIRDREAREDHEKQIREAREAKEKEEREAIEKLNREQLERDGIEKELTEGMIKNWAFKRAADGFEKLAESSSNQQKKNLQARKEMAGLAQEFFTSVCSDIPSLPNETKRIKLANGEQVLLLDGSAESCRILDKGVSRAVPWASISPVEFVRLHRESVSIGGKSAKDIMKRHAGAIIFLFLTDNRDIAEKAAAKLSESDAKFSIKWEKWMASLQEGQDL